MSLLDMAAAGRHHLGETREVTGTIEDTAKGRAEALVATALEAGVTNEGAIGHSATLVIIVHAAGRPRLTTAPVSRRAVVANITPERESRTQDCNP